MYQTLVGDLTDGFGGCPTIGGVKASRVLAVCPKDLPEMWDAVVAEYKRQKLDEEYALTQARLARILRASDWDNKKTGANTMDTLIRDILLIVVGALSAGLISILLAY